MHYNKVGGLERCIGFCVSCRLWRPPDTAHSGEGLNDFDMFINSDHGIRRAKSSHIFFAKGHAHA